MLEIELEGCRIRPWSDQDIESLVRHANDERVSRQLLDSFPHPYGRDDAEHWIALVKKLRPMTHFTIDVDGAAVGGIGLSLRDGVHRKTAEIGYWIGHAFWGRGIATKAVRAFTQWGFSTHDLARIDASVFEGNRGSMRVLEKAGYVREGTHRYAVFRDGRILDEVVYAAYSPELLEETQS